MSEERPWRTRETQAAFRAKTRFWYGTRCYRCIWMGWEPGWGRRMWLRARRRWRWAADHVDPGSTNPDETFRPIDSVRNAQPLCPRCNGWKGNRNADDFRGACVRGKLVRWLVRGRLYGFDVCYGGA